MIKIKIPSKTFICGEYVALEGGPALVVNTPPEFNVCMTKSDSNLVNNKLELHEGSPSYKFFHDNKEIFEDIEFEFNDPHKNRGGFGASGAKFNSLVAVKKILSDKPLFNSLNFRDKLLHYSTYKQSGYDVISQFNGQVCFIHLAEKKVERLSWPFPDQVITIVRTGHSLNTHEDIDSLKDNDYGALRKVSHNAYTSLKNVDFTGFCDAVNNYYKELQKLNLICERSLFLTNKIKSETTWLPAVKACGAAGADTILFIHNKENIEKTKKYILEIGLELVYSGNELSQGMSISGDFAGGRGIDYA